MNDTSSEVNFSISVIMKRMLLSVDVFVLRIFIFFCMPCYIMAIGGSSFLWSASSSNTTVMEWLSSVIIEISLYLHVCITKFMLNLIFFFK